MVVSEEEVAAVVAELVEGWEEADGDLGAVVVVLEVLVEDFADTGFFDADVTVADAVLAAGVAFLAAVFLVCFGATYESS